MQAERAPITQTLALGLVAAFLAVDIVWLMASSLTFDWSSSRGLVRAFTAILGCALLLTLIEWRLLGDRSWPARALRWTAVGTRRLAGMLGLMALMTSVVAILSYLVVATALPLQDARFAAMDRALGFDWTGFLAWINARPLLAQALSAAYHTSLAQVLGVIGLLTLLDRRRDLWDFMALFALTSVAVVVISALVPAAGATVFHAPDPALLTSFHPDAGRYHYAAFAAVRDGTLAHISLDRIEGLVQFPSFHTILAILVTHAVRNVRFLLWPMLVLNGAVIVSTLTEGGHYLVDVLAGAAIALLAIRLVADRHALGDAAQVTPVPAASEGFVWQPVR